MKTQDFFLVFLKGFGLWLIFLGLDGLPMVLDRIHSFSDSTDFFYMALGSFVTPALLVAIGYWLLFSDWVGRTIFPSLATKASVMDAPPIQTQVWLLDLFQALLGTLGIIEIAIGLSGLPVAFSFAHGVQKSQATFFGYLYMFGPPIVSILCGCWLLSATHWIVCRSFPKYVASNPKDLNELELPLNHFLFAVIVKCIGIWVLFAGLQKISISIFQFAYYAGESIFLYRFARTFGSPLIALVLGSIALFATNWLVQLAFAKQCQTNGGTVDNLVSTE